MPLPELQDGEVFCLPTGGDRASIPPSIKVQAVADVLIGGASRNEAVCGAVEALGQNVPDNPHRVFGQWRQYINQQLARGNPIVIELCQKANIPLGKKVKGKKVKVKKNGRKK